MAAAHPNLEAPLRDLGQAVALDRVLRERRDQVVPAAVVVVRRRLLDALVVHLVPRALCVAGVDDRPDAVAVACHHADQMCVCRWGARGEGSGHCVHQ